MGICHVFWVPVFVLCIEVAKQNNVHLSCFVKDGLEVLIKNAGTRLSWEGDSSILPIEIGGSDR